MLFLPIDIGPQSLQLRRPERKRTIPSLPGETRQLGKFIFDPLGRRCFQLLDYFRDRNGAGETNGKMNVIFYTTSAITLTTDIASNRSKIRSNATRAGAFKTGIRSFVLKMT